MGRSGAARGRTQAGCRRPRAAAQSAPHLDRRALPIFKCFGYEMTGCIKRRGENFQIGAAAGNIPSVFASI